jgi:hypothetical protein
VTLTCVSLPVVTSSSAFDIFPDPFLIILGNTNLMFLLSDGFDFFLRLSARNQGLVVGQNVSRHRDKHQDHHGPRSPVLVQARLLFTLLVMRMIGVMGHGESNSGVR